MKQVKTIKDLPVGTPVIMKAHPNRILDGPEEYRGLVSSCVVSYDGRRCYPRLPHVRILFSDGKQFVFYEDEINGGRFYIMEAS